MKRKLVTALLMSVALSSCCSVVNGKSQTISFSSEPSGASVIIDGAERGKTPFSLELERGKEYEVTLKKEGYKDAAAYVAHTPSGWVCGNLILGAIVGSVGVLIDAHRGALWNLEPETVNVSMEKLQTHEGMRSSTTDPLHSQRQRHFTLDLTVGKK